MDDLFIYFKILKFMYAPFRIRRSGNKAREKQIKIRETGSIMKIL